MQLDHSVYPDLDSPPVELNSPEEKADYLQRICGAWDFGVLPEPDTFALFQKWRDIFDRFPLLHSPAYHAFRSWFHWPPVKGSCLEADYERFDAIEQRDDPCARWI